MPLMLSETALMRVNFTVNLTMTGNGHTGIFPSEMARLTNVHASSVTVGVIDQLERACCQRGYFGRFLVPDELAYCPDRLGEASSEICRFKRKDTHRDWRAIKLIADARNHIQCHDGVASKHHLLPQKSARSSNRSRSFSGRHTVRIRQAHTT